MKSLFQDLRQGLTPDNLIAELRQKLQIVTDTRASNRSFSLSDILMCGYAMFSLKYSSLLQFETQTQVERQNLQHLYGIKKVCTDSQMRKILDKCDPQELRVLYATNFKELEHLGITNEYESAGFLIIAIDGVTHFQSNHVKCPHCLEKKFKDGTISYSHSMLCAMLVNPDQKEVFVMGTEPILKQDGIEKNDCERNASKRLINWLSEHYKGKNFLITEDALYSNAPNIIQILENNWSYILGIKPDGNKHLFAIFDKSKADALTNEQPFEEHSVTQKGINHSFKYVNKVSLNSSNKDVIVNVLLYQQTDKKGKTTQFAWVTNLHLEKKSIIQVMKIGRSRWKIENETFNTLKNQGYNFEHNYGHGKENLSTILAYLMFLAFHNDQLIQRCNQQFKKIWEAAKSRLKIWQALRALFFVVKWQSFKELYDNMASIFKVKLE